MNKYSKSEIQLGVKSAMAMPLEIPTAYLNNPRIMKVVQDSFGPMNQNYVPIFNQTTVTDFQHPNVHYMFNGEKFVPAPMSESVFVSNTGTDMLAKTYAADLPLPKGRTMVQKTPLVAPRVQKADSNILHRPIPVKHTVTDTKKFTFSSPKITSTSHQNANINSAHEDKTLIKTEHSIAPNRNIQNSAAKTIFCTGTIERILRWNRILKDIFCLYETIAPVISLQEGRLSQQKIMLLRDKKGPILQVQYFTITHIDIDDFHIGQHLRCVGRMIGFNILLAESIRVAKEDEISSLSRLSYVCDYSVNHNINQE